MLDIEKFYGAFKAKLNITALYTTPFNCIKQLPKFTVTL